MAITKENIKLLAFDLDGTLSQHKSPPPKETFETLEKLSKKYRLLMVGAGDAYRIFNQLNRFPIDIVGNYGLQYAKYNPQTKDLDFVYDLALPCDKKACEDRVQFLREKYGFTNYSGDSVQFHASGCVTFAILGTNAVLEDKLKFDPTREKRRKFYDEVVSLFPEYNVFVGGSSSFDMAPKPYNKYDALSKYCTEYGYSHEQAVFFGDDYGQGGNDESVYKSDFNFVKVDNYLDFPKLAEFLL